MASFTSALYLGFTHPHGQLAPWRALTTGMPAVLGEPATAQRVARATADLLGVEQVVLSPSTLHACWDVVDRLCTSGDVGFVVDRGAYPVARWALEHASSCAAPVRSFRHHDVAHLRRILDGPALRSRRPVLVTDGFCTRCGPSPLVDLTRLAARRDGWVVVDDTQAIGVLGASPTPVDPFGTGGGGTLWATGADRSRVVLVASLAKAFGAPLAVTGGPSSFVGGLARSAATRLHSSPPSSADVSAAEVALAVNRSPAGERRRRALARIVARLRAGLDRLGVMAHRALFPVQSAGPFPVATARRIHGHLRLRGVETALQAPACGSGALVTFVVTAAHRPADVDHALAVLASALHRREVRRAC